MYVHEMQMTVLRTVGGHTKALIGRAADDPDA